MDQTKEHYVNHECTKEIYKRNVQIFKKNKFTKEMSALRFQGIFLYNKKLNYPVTPSLSLDQMLIFF